MSYPSNNDDDGTPNDSSSNDNPSNNANVNDSALRNNRDNTNQIRGPNINAFVDTLMRRVLDDLPLAHVAQLSAQLLNQVKEFVRRHLLTLAGTLLSTAGLAVLLPSLAVVIVNALGFTASGIVLGSAAAAIQSSIYGAFTGGLFSIVQSFGATAVVASPIGLAAGSILLTVGVGFLGWRLWRWYNRGPNAGNHSGPDDDDDDDDDDNERKHAANESAVVMRGSSFNFLNLFRRSSR